MVCSTASSYQKMVQMPPDWYKTGQIHVVYFKFSSKISQQNSRLMRPGNLVPFNSVLIIWCNSQQQLSEGALYRRVKTLRCPKASISCSYFKWVLGCGLLLLWLICLRVQHVVHSEMLSFESFESFELFSVNSMAMWENLIRSAISKNIHATIKIT